MISYTTFYLSFCKNKKEKIFSLINGSFHFVRRLTKSRTSGINQRNFSFRQSRKNILQVHCRSLEANLFQLLFVFLFLNSFDLDDDFCFILFFTLSFFLPYSPSCFLFLSLSLNIYLSHSVHTYTWVIEWQNGKNKNSNLS